MKSWLSTSSHYGNTPPYGVLSDGSARGATPVKEFVQGPAAPWTPVNGKKQNLKKQVRWALSPPSSRSADCSASIRGGDTLWNESPLKPGTRWVPPSIPGIRWVSPSIPSSSASMDNRSGKVGLMRLCIMGTGPIGIDDFWARLRQRLGMKDASLVQKALLIRQPNGQSRVDVWVLEDSAPLFKKLMGKTRKWHWNTVYWAAWLARFNVEKPREPKPEEVGTCNGVVTWNINGWRGRSEQVQYFMGRSHIAVALLQETLVYSSDRQISIPGYDVFSLDAKKSMAGARGQAICVRKWLKATSLNLNDSNIIGVRVPKLPGEGCWYIYSIYLPSGGNYRRDRGLAVKRMRRLLKRLIRKEPAAKILVGGDWNIDRERMVKTVSRWNLPLTVQGISGSTKTRRPKDPHANWTSLDYFLTSVVAQSALTVSRVDRSWDASDHFAVRTTIRNMSSSSVGKPAKRFERQKLRGLAEHIVNDNRWTILASLGEETSLDQFEEKLVEVSNEIAEEKLVRVPTGGKAGKHYLDRKTKELIAKRRKLQRDIDCGRVQEGRMEEARNLLLVVKKKIDVKISHSRQKHHMLLIRRGARLFTTGQMAAFWRWIDNFTHFREQSVRRSDPLRDSNGVLQTSEEAIANVLRMHYTKLGQDLGGNSKNLQHWTDLWSVEPRGKPDENFFKKPISWLEVKERIKKSAYGRATGVDGIPYEWWKLAPWEKRMRRDNEERTEPPNPMAKALLMYVNRCYVEGQLPEKDLLSEVTSIYKTGDTSSASNYRGIFLINHKAKLVGGTETERFVQHMENEKILYPEQGGFRRGEDVLAQVCSLYEVVRRRAIGNQPTYIFFGDLVKAFDMVPFDAVIASMERAGVTEPATKLTQSTYHKSYQCCVVGDARSQQYKVQVGTKQGDVPTPPKFDLFINPLIRQLRGSGGVAVPGLQRRVSSLHFADDALGLAENPGKLQEIVDISDTWARSINMKWGLPKCGVMILGATEEQRSAFKQLEFRLAGGIVPHVSTYKYLGMHITENFGTLSQERPDIVSHVKDRRDTAFKILHKSRSFLRCRTIPVHLRLQVVKTQIVPVTTYGGEWCGMHSRMLLQKLREPITKALKWIIGYRSSNVVCQTVCIYMEMGIPFPEAMVAKQRTRAWLKWDRSKTIISELMNEKHSSRTKTWVTHTTNWLSKELKIKPDDLKIKRGDAEKEDELLKLVFEKVTSSILQQEGSGENSSVTQYVGFEFEKTRGFIKAATWMPSLAMGVVWMIRFRTNAMWTRERWLQQCDRNGKGHDLHWSEAKKCPACGLVLDCNERYHLLIECTSYATQREQYIGPFLKSAIVAARLLRPRLDVRPVTDTGIAAVLLLGGFMGKTGWYFTKAFGHNPKETLRGKWKFGFIPVALFLAEIMSHHMDLIFDTDSSGLTKRYGHWEGGYFTDSHSDF